jgi:hypothetical protein
MKKNLGSLDRIVRIAIGLAALGAGAWFKSWWGLAGLIALGTGLIGFCPLYCPFGLKTCPVKDR